MFPGAQGLNMSLTYNAKYQKKVPVLTADGKPVLNKQGKPTYQWIFPVLSTPMGGLRSGLLSVRQRNDIPQGYRGILQRLFN